MNEDEMIDWLLLESYAVGKVTPTERARVEQWLAAHADNQPTFAKVQGALQARHRHSPRDWRRAEAIETVMARVRLDSPGPTTVVVPRRKNLMANPMAERLMDRIRRWFEGATELAAAMLLDAEERALTDEEVTALRNRIGEAKRDRS